MVHIFKISGKKIAYDSASGAIVALTALASKMLGALTAPLLPVCPTSLRYELAKYDSEDVSDTYEALYDLQEKGILFAAETGEAKLMLAGDYAAESEDIMAEAMRTAKAAGAKNITFVGSSSLLDAAQKLADEIF